MTVDFQGRMIEEIEEVVEPKTETFYVFAEYEVDIEMYYKDHHIKDLCTMGDFHGEFMCVEFAIKEALEYAEHYRIDKDSEAEIRVLLRKVHIKKQKTGGKQVFNPKEDEYRAVKFGSQLHKEERTIWTTRDPLPWKEVLARVREEEGI